MSRSRRLIAVLGVAIATSLLFLIVREAVEAYPPEGEYVLENGQLLGGDFSAFYVAGRIFDNHRDRLYDLDFQRDVRRDLLAPFTDAAIGELPFV